MTKKIVFTIMLTIFVFVLSACGDDGSRIVGTWTGATGGTAWRYEFYSDGTGAWGNNVNITSEPVWDPDLARYVVRWTNNIMPTTWNISGDILEVILDVNGQVNVYNFEFSDDSTLLLTREGWLTSFELSRLD